MTVFFGFLQMSNEVYWRLSTPRPCYNHGRITSSHLAEEGTLMLQFGGGIIAQGNCLLSLYFKHLFGNIVHDSFEMLDGSCKN